MAKKILCTLMCFFVLFFLVACESTNHDEQEMAVERAVALKAIEAEKEAARTVESRISAMREEEKSIAKMILTQTPVITPAASEFKYDIASDGGVKIIKYLGNAMSIKIPEKIEGLSVTEIEKGAFDNSPVKKIVLPTIKKMEISGHPGLREVILEDGWKNVPNFSNCKSLSKIVIPDSVTSIYYGVFKNCTSLSEIVIPDSVTSVGDFENCTSLSEIVIPNSVTSIGGGAFKNCTSLSKIVIPNSVTSIKEGAFENCTSLNEIVIPDSVTSIGLGAFANCGQLTSIKLPKGLKVIFSYVFAGSGLESIVIPDSVVGIDEHAFYGCKSLTSVTLPASLTNLGSSVFEECSSLSEINIPESLKKIVFRYNKLRFDCDKDEYLSVGVTRFNIFGLEVEGYRIKDDASGTRYYYNDGDRYFYTYYGIPTEEIQKGREYDGVSCFSGCSNLPLATKSKLRELGYDGEF